MTSPYPVRSVVVVVTVASLNGVGDNWSISYSCGRGCRRQGQFTDSGSVPFLSFSFLAFLPSVIFFKQCIASCGLLTTLWRHVAARVLFLRDAISLLFFNFKVVMCGSKVLNATGGVNKERCTACSLQV